MGDMNKRTQYSAEYKAGIVIRVLREEETVGEIASKEGLNSVMISRWKAEFLERAKMVFDRAPTQAEKELAEEKERRAMLERKVGQLTIENDWLKKKSEEVALRYPEGFGRKR
jgi:transposase